MDNSWWCCRRARGHQSFWYPPAFFLISFLVFSIHRIFENRASMVKVWWCWRRNIWSISWEWSWAQHWSYGQSLWSDWTNHASVHRAMLEHRLAALRRTWWNQKVSSTTSRRWRFQELAAPIQRSSDCGASVRRSCNPTSIKQFINIASDLNRN